MPARGVRRKVEANDDDGDDTGVDACGAEHTNHLAELLRKPPQLHDGREAKVRIARPAESADS